MAVPERRACGKLDAQGAPPLLGASQPRRMEGRDHVGEKVLVALNEALSPPHSPPCPFKTGRLKAAERPELAAERPELAGATQCHVLAAAELGKRPQALQQPESDSGIWAPGRSAFFPASGPSRAFHGSQIS